MSYSCAFCGTTIMDDDESLCPQCSASKKMSELPYYKRYVKFPDAPRPNEPCNDFEHPVRWALLAYWEKARADRAESEIERLRVGLARATAALEAASDNFKRISSDSWDTDSASIVNETLESLRAQHGGQS